LAPIGSNLALLSLDGVDPWGRSAAVPPRGDLRAPVSVLLAACDAVVTIDDGAPASIDRVEVDRDVWSARVVSRGAHGPSGEILSWEDLRNVRTGLLTALARPDRVTRALARRGVKPCVIVHGRDHGPLPSFVRTVTARLASGAEPKPELWLATAKCALHAARSGLRGPLATLDYSVSIPPRLCDALRSIPAP